MTKKYSTKKALIASFLILCMCFTMLIGTTFAWFTDSVTSSGNVIKTGTLNIGFYWAEGKIAPEAANWIDASTGAIFNNDKWEPGYTEARHLKIVNKGTLALKYQLAIEPNGDVSELADVIDVYYVDPAEQVEDRFDLDEADKIGTLRDLIKTGIQRGALVADDKTTTAVEGVFTATLVLKMQESAGNEYQNKSIGTDFAIKLIATQYASEEDSFDKFYDAGAPWLGEVNTEWYDANPAAKEFTINTAEDLAGLAEVVNSGKDNFNGDKITLASNLDLNDNLWTPVGVPGARFEGTFDGAGHTIYNLYVNNSKYAGLFGNTWGSAHIEGLTINGAFVTGNDYVGAIVGGGYMSSNCIKNCTVKNAEISAVPYLLADGVTYDGGAKAGAIGGAVYNTNVENNKAINCKITAYRDLGGIAGMLYADGNLEIKAAGNEVDNVTIEYFDLEGAAYESNTTNENMGSIVGRLQTNGNTQPKVENSIETNVKYGDVTTWIDNGALYTKNEDTGVYTLRELSADYKEAEFTVPEGITNLGNFAFSNSTVESVVLASSVKDLGRGFDTNNSIKKVVLNEGLEVISSRAFRSTMAIEEVVISSTVHTIADNAFQKSAIKTLTIPANVKTIGEAAFGASLIETVIIEGNTNIEGFAFRGCTKLSTVYLNGNNVKFVPSTLNNRNSTWFCNSESNNPNTSNIDFYVKNEVIKERVLTAMGAERNNTDVYCEIEAEEVVNGVYTDTTTGETYTYASTNDDLKNAVASGANVIYASAGTYSTLPVSDKMTENTTIICADGTVFEGKSSLNINGATVVGATFDAGSGDTSATGTINGTFKDCTFTGGSEGVRWCYSDAGKTVVFENCVFESTLRGIHFDDMKGDVIFRNCELNGFNAIGGSGTVTFEGCTFGCDRSRYNGLNMYVDTTLTDCTFEFISGKTNFIDFEDSGKTLKITNCTATLDGEAADVLAFVGGTYRKQTNIIVDGAQVVFTSDALEAAIEAKASKVLLADGEYTLRFTNDTNFNVDGMTFTGIGDNVKLSISSSEAWYGRIQGDNVTFENIHFKSSVGTTGKATYNECTFDDWTICASSNNAETYYNNCTIKGCLNTSTDFSSGNIFLKGCYVEKAEFSGASTMNFEDCTIGELISWDMTTVLTGCTVTTIVTEHMTSNTITVDGTVVAP